MNSNRDNQVDTTTEIVVQKVNDFVPSPTYPSNEPQTVRISIEKLNSLLQQSEELISIKSTSDYFAKELQTSYHQYALWNRKANEQFRKIENRTNDQESSDFFALDKEFRKKQEGELYRLTQEVTQFKHVTGRMIDDLLHDMKTALLFPFSSMLGLFPKIVRDLSKEYAKEIELDIRGEGIEIDRRILEELKDPLLHLIRNCIDHGIESADERVQKGKPAKGKIRIEIIQSIDRKIELHLSDDGAGLDKNKIINAALKAGILKTTDVEKLTDKEIYALIFHSGISTSSILTTISGRGLGMAIVSEKVAKLGGILDFETQKDGGTSFIITLPLTLTTFRGFLIKAADQHLMIPSFVVERAIRIKKAAITTVESRQTICYKNETIGLIFLRDVLKLASARTTKKSDDYLHLLLLSISQKKMAFVVDEILGESEGIVKELGLYLSQVTNIAGATILGNGSVVPILNPSELMDSAIHSNASTAYSLESAPLTDGDVQKRILIVEDSITIRTLLRNFIENAGFYVETSIDGMEAFELLQKETFDLLVTDIEMPRMNGFELTAKIREDTKQADLPIILVTALETAEDKQRGMEVGANAYLVKSSFEKSNLMETIQRLI